jgi:hypothetical protein
MALYAIAITKDNIRGVIQSEAGKSFNLETALKWLEDHEKGWFVRDPESPLDCEFFMPEVFAEMYMFIANDRDSLIRRIAKI